MVQYSVAKDICSQNFETGSGSCGFNSYCVPDADGRSTCICPSHYSPIDPARIYKGCKPDFAAQSCEPGAETSFTFQQLSNVDWPLNDAEQFSPMNETECSDNCLKDCFCLVAIYKRDSGTCWKKKFPLSNGKSRTDFNRIAFIKYSTVNNSMSVVLENNVRNTAKLFKLNFQEGRNFSILIEACGALFLRVDRVPLREYLGAAS